MASRQQKHGNISEDAGSVMPFIRGGLSGMTGGLERYIAAPMMMAIDRLMKGGMTYEEALDALRRQEQQDVETAPVARAGGQVLGSLVPGSQLAKGGKAAVILGNTALGAAQGFSANPASEGTTLKDTLTGAGLGATLGLVGAGASAAMEGLARTQAAHGIKNTLMKDAAWKTTAKKTIRELGGGSGKNGAVTTADLQAHAAKEAAQRAATGEVPAITEVAKSGVADRLKSGVMTQLRGVPTQALMGAGAGGLGSLLSGQDPMTGAMLGAGSVLAYSKANALQRAQGTLRAAAGQQLMAHPGVQRTVSAMPVVATPVVGAVMTKEPTPPAPQEPVVEFDPWETPTPKKAAPAEVETDPWETPTPKKTAPKKAAVVEKDPWE